MRLWVRPVLVVGVLAGSLLIAPRASLFQLLAPLALGAFLLLLRRPILGLMALIPAGLVVPFAVGTGSATRINAVVLMLPLLILLLAAEMVMRHRLVLYRSRTIPPLFVFCAVVALAFLAGLEPWMPFAANAPLRAQAGGLALFLLSAGAFLLVGHQLKTVGQLEAMTWPFMAVGALYMAGRLLPNVGVPSGAPLQKGADGSLLWVWLSVMAMSQATFNRRLSPIVRLGLALLVVATFYVAFSKGLDWTSGWLPALVGCLVVLLAGKPKLGLLVAVATGLALALDPSAATKAVMGGDNQYSLSTRVEAWTILEKVVETSPLLGLGPANYYHYTPLFPIQGYAVSFNSHNNYVDLVAQTGLLGLVCFLWFALEVAWLGWRLRKKVPAGFQRAYVCGAIGGLAGTLVAAMLGDWVIPFVYNIGFDGFRASVLAWVFLGGLVAVEQWSRTAPSR